MPITDRPNEGMQMLANDWEQLQLEIIKRNKRILLKVTLVCGCDQSRVSTRGMDVPANVNSPTTLNCEHAIKRLRC